MIYLDCEKIKALREARGITQAELARKLSITRGGVNSWEQGFSTPSPASIVEPAHVLRCIHGLPARRFVLSGDRYHGTVAARCGVVGGTFRTAETSVKITVISADRQKVPDNDVRHFREHFPDADNSKKIRRFSGGANRRKLSDF
ncbi:MAG: XRE family transcriptional regulator [Ruminococcaceae bacterium]|nr:XRE family transcriptional regulator [Oscillospiraceae bacterium]